MKSRVFDIVLAVAAMGIIPVVWHAVETHARSPVDLPPCWEAQRLQWLEENRATARPSGFGWIVEAGGKTYAQPSLAAAVDSAWSDREATR